jgi:hypothetical protein
MREIRPIGPYRDVLEGRAPELSSLVVNLGLRQDSFEQILHHNIFTMVAQYYGIVQDGLLNAIHAFRGLKRPLMHGDDKEADKSVLVYSWRAEIDFVWSGGRFDGKPIEKIPPSNRVFVVLVREEKQPNNYTEVGDIFGSVERWNWVKEDPTLPHAPVDWRERYGEKLWSRL